jgi:hypothetical protein
MKNDFMGNDLRCYSSLTNLLFFLANSVGKINVETLSLFQSQLNKPQRHSRAQRKFLLFLDIEHIFVEKMCMKKLVPLAIGLMIMISSGLAQNPRNVLLYNLTDTDCGPCSCMDSIIRNSLLPVYPRTVVVALHSPMFNSHFREYQGNNVFFYFHSDFEPSGFIDGLGFDVTYKKVVDSVGQRYAHSSDAPVSISIDSKLWNPITREVTLNMTLKNLGPDILKPVWFNIFVTEDHLIANHRIFTGCAKASSPTLPFDTAYVNDHVIRKLEYFEHGTPLIEPSWASQHSFSKQVTVKIDSGWVEGNTNLNIAVYEYNDSLYKAPILQAVRQSVSGGVSVPEPFSNSYGIVKIYPNPAVTWANIHLTVEKEDIYTLKISDMTSRTVEKIFTLKLAPGSYNFDLNLANYPAGSYVCTFGPAGSESSSILIIRR